MLSRLDHNMLISPFSAEISSPCFLSMRIRCFRSSRPARHSQVSSNPNRISRSARTEAQNVLFDYLHATRSFRFTDAEHISKNSPIFLQNLVSELELDRGISCSLSKFLRYNPINEFEPFFESLGLNPSEFSPLLPNNMIFLTDDHVLLENYHVLSDYGIPRSKIGKMYKAEKQILGYDYGVLASKLRAYEDLGLSKSTVIKLVTCCPSLLIGGINSHFVMVVEKLNKLGFENDWLGRFLTTNVTYNWRRICDTIHFLEEVGYSEMQMRVLLEKDLGLLLEGSGKKVYAIAAQLLKVGLPMCVVSLLFLQNPQIMSQKFIRNINKAVALLYEIGLNTEDIANVVSSQFLFLGSTSWKGPKSILKDLELGKDTLSSSITADQQKFLTLASKSNTINIGKSASENPSKHLEKITFLTRLGYVENSEEMAQAIKKFRGRGDQLQERFDCLVKAGIDCNVVSSMIKQAPELLNQSKDVLEKKLDFLRNCLGYPLESVVSFPAFLGYDMERISMRFSMYAWLRERGAAKPFLSLSTILACSNARFVKYFVDIHPEGPAIYLYTGKLKPSPPDMSTCVDNGCPRDACRPAIDFAVKLMYTYAIFQVPPLVSLFQTTFLKVNFHLETETVKTQELFFLVALDGFLASARLWGMAVIICLLPSLSSLATTVADSEYELCHLNPLSLPHHLKTVVNLSGLL
ncbi:Transcription termination factor, mitochondrial/chloroplastic [Dillenia turbinata]|uniref:Transcription termination factor, mitochondrial/chloroplastic n=1 Tax=Dillenia turbinata TaxID=194707 RepID=A0AAN8VRB5_9MAGN